MSGHLNRPESSRRRNGLDHFSAQSTRGDPLIGLGYGNIEPESNALNTSSVSPSRASNVDFVDPLSPTVPIRSAETADLPTLPSQIHANGTTTRASKDGFLRPTEGPSRSTVIERATDTDENTSADPLNALSSFGLGAQAAPSDEMESGRSTTLKSKVNYESFPQSTHTVNVDDEQEIEVGESGSMEKEKEIGKNLKRPTLEDIRNVYTSLFTNPHLTLEDFQQLPLSLHGLGESEDDVGNVTLRSIHWRLFLGRLQLRWLTSTQTQDRHEFETELTNRRMTYISKRDARCRAPDGRWAEDCTRPVTESAIGSSPSAAVQTRDAAAPSPSDNPSKWDPLNDGEGNPWKFWFDQEEIRATIHKDVERTFPDIPYFRNAEVRRILTTILYVWAIESPDIGYRQGMHELLAVFLLIFDRDAVLDPVDALASPIPPSPQVNSFERAISSGEVDRAVRFLLDRSHLESDVYDAFSTLMTHANVWYEWKNGGRVLVVCKHIQDDLLAKVDPVLHGKITAEGIEGQLWAIRYVRMMFTREIPFSTALRLWDGIFALGFQLVDSLCVALLLRIRALILTGDYATILTYLLRYPGDSRQLPLSPPYLLRQAQRILQRCDPSTGAGIAVENEELGIETYIPPSAPATKTKSAGYNLEGLAKGLFERAQSSGIDRAILSRVSDIRRNLPASSSFQFRSFTPEAVIEDEEPRLVVRPVEEAEQELTELKARVANLGNRLEHWLQSARAGAYNWNDLEDIQKSLALHGVGSSFQAEGLEQRSTASNTSFSTPTAPSNFGSLPNLNTSHDGLASGHSTPPPSGQVTPKSSRGNTRLSLADRLAAAAKAKVAARRDHPIASMDINSNALTKDPLLGQGI